MEERPLLTKPYIGLARPGESQVSTERRLYEEWMREHGSAVSLAERRERVEAAREERRGDFL